MTSFIPSRHVKRCLALALSLTAGALVSACAVPALVPAPRATPASLLNAGVAALKAGNTDLASTKFHAVLAADPANTHKLDQIAYYDLGVIAEGQNNTTAAVSAYQSAINLDPNYAAPKYNLAIEETTSNPTAAIALYKEVIAISPNDVNAIYNVGLLLYQSGQVPAGQVYLAQAIKMDPSLTAKLPAGVTP